MPVRVPPRRSRVKRIVVMPSSIFLGEDRRLSTFRLGLLARYFAMFRVEEVLVFRDGGDLRFVVDVLRYAEVPQYLRRRLVPLKRTLRYVGVIPPLQAPHHPPPPGGRGFESEFRDGVVLGAAGEWLMVDAGLREPLRVRGRARTGSRVTLRVRGEVELVDKSRVPYYWGYRVRVAESLGDALDACSSCLRVATSRRGVDVRLLANRLVEEAEFKGAVALFFGTRDRGLYEIAGEEGLEVNEVFDMVLNFVPGQGVYTVRTEEAIPVALSILNFLLE